MSLALLLPLAARFDANSARLRQILRFFGELFDARVGTTDLVVWGAIFLGVTSGVLGCFIVLRRQSLLGDAIGHSVLPGVCLGFLIAGGRSTPALLLGALVFGLAAALLIGLLRRTTQLKTGECTGVVFTGFYGLGIVLLKFIQNLNSDENTVAGGLARFFIRLGIFQPFNSGQAGLDKFLFGQIVGISPSDVLLMGAIAIGSIGAVMVFWRKLAAWSFDEQFAFSIGLPIRTMDYLVTALMTVAIVISIQAVGVVLVAAMLVTPAATAYLLTDRLHRMVMLAAAFGATAGVLGAFVSLLGKDLPTGSLMVLGASLLFAAAFLLSPRHGLLPRLARLWQRRRRTQAENLLRTLYIITEKRHGGAVPLGDGIDRRFGVDDVAAQRQETRPHVRKLWRLAAGYGWVDRRSTDPMLLTDQGLAEARRVVRNHRLWELFLTQEARLASDHVHADAEHIEHVLPRDVLHRLEQMLDNPVADPHGRAIP